MNAHKKWFNDQTSLTSERVAKYLADEGKNFNQDKYEEYEPLAAKNTDSLFYLAISISLEWAGFVTNSPAFFQDATDFLTGNNTTELNDLKKHTLRKEEAVFDVLPSWKLLLKQSVGDKLVGDLSLDQLVQYQLLMWDALIQLKTSKRLHHLGVWFFLAPFKIMVLMKPQFWGEASLDKLYMPVGAQVDKGLEYLKKHDIEEASHWGKLPKFGDIQSALAEVEQAQAIQLKLAQHVDSKVLHLNSGLHLLG